MEKKSLYIMTVPKCPNGRVNHGEINTLLLPPCPHSIPHVFQPDYSSEDPDHCKGHGCVPVNYSRRKNK